ncbi:MAG: hypothetical protein ACR2PR_03325 [Pseudohongiellaceae bacterium]
MAFVPIGTTDGSDWHGKLREGVILADIASNIFLGDMLTTDADGSDATGRAEAVTLGTAGTGNALAGAVVEFTPDFSDEGSLIRNYHLASTLQRCKLVHGTDVIYEAPQTAGAVLTVAGINDNTNLDITGTGDLFTGISVHGIGATATATGDQFRLRGFTSTEGDTAQVIPIGTLGATWRVTLNNSVDAHATGGV